MRSGFFVKAAVLTALIIGCSNSEEENRGRENDPSVMQPPSEAIPDSMRLVSDSVIVPDLTPGNGSQVGDIDSIRRTQH